MFRATVDVDDDPDILLIHNKIGFLFETIQEEILPDIEEKIQESTVQVPSPLMFKTTPTFSSGGRGRPKFNIDVDQVIQLRCIGYKWNAIADFLGVSVRTLHRRRQEANIGEFVSYTDISDEEICRQLLLLKEEFPDIGERIAIGLFRSKGIIIPRRRLRHAFHTVDAVNTSLRWHLRLKRRKYSVPGPMSLWHQGESYMLSYMSPSPASRFKSIYDNCLL